MNDEVNRTQPPDDVAIYLKKEGGCTYGFLAPIVTLIDGWSWAWPGDIFLIVRIEKTIFFWLYWSNPEKISKYFLPAQSTFIIYQLDMALYYYKLAGIFLD